MPTYDYDCKKCGPFEAIRQMSHRNDDISCPVCGLASQRILAFGSQLTFLDQDTRRAIEGNERSAHAPMTSTEFNGGYKRLRHPSGCGCCTGVRGKKSSTHTFANGNKTFVGKRPWMISH